MDQKAIALLLLAATACRVNGPVQTEPGTVESHAYHPAQSGSGSGVSSSGDAVFTSSYAPAVYGVVFRCQHGRFASSGQDDRHRELWGRLQDGQAVTISYRTYRLTPFGSTWYLDFLDAR